MTTAGQSIFIDSTVVDRYQRRMRGELFRPATVAVEAPPSAPNQQANKQPLLVARCLSAHDVAIAIALARELGLELIVQSDHIAHCVNVPSILIDLSELRQIIIDPLQRIARVEPGATNSEFTQVAATYGFTTSDTILAFEVITAEGATITASAYEHVDVFAALCGSRGTVGIVVTASMYRLHVLPPGQENKTGDNLWTSQ